MTRFSPYKKRPIRYLRLETPGPWNVKVYTISARDEFPSDKLVESSIRRLPEWLEFSDRYDLPLYHYALLIIHEAKEGNYVLVNWWIGENMLQHFVYYSTHANPGEFKRVSDNGLMACVWELEVIDFERKAWLQHVLKKPRNPDFDNYLSMKLNTDI